MDCCFTVIYDIIISFKILADLENDDDIIVDELAGLISDPTEEQSVIDGRLAIQIEKAVEEGVTGKYQCERRTLYLRP